MKRVSYAEFDVHADAVERRSHDDAVKHARQVARNFSGFPPVRAISREYADEVAQTLATDGYWRYLKHMSSNPAITNDIFGQGIGVRMLLTTLPSEAIKLMEYLQLTGTDVDAEFYNVDLSDESWRFSGRSALTGLSFNRGWYTAVPIMPQVSVYPHGNEPTESPNVFRGIGEPVNFTISTVLAVTDGAGSRWMNPLLMDSIEPLPEQG